MKFPLHLVIDYAHTKPAEIDRALEQLFGNGPLPKDLTSEEEELLQGLFGEWLINEYRQTNGSTFLTEYILTQPGKVSNKIIDQFTQIAQSNFYSEFEFRSVKPGDYIVVEDIFTGKVYYVYDKLGSQNAPVGSTSRMRLARVDGRWYAVGSNPVLLPLHFTERLKKILRTEIKPPRPTLKDTVELIRQPKLPPPKIPTKEELKEKREEIEKQFSYAVIKHKSQLTFVEVKQAVFAEDRVNPGDFWQGLVKRGLPMKFLLEDFQILQDLWNYFPHRCLNDLSPIEVYTRMRRAKK